MSRRIKLPLPPPPERSFMSRTKLLATLTAALALGGGALYATRGGAETISTADAAEPRTLVAPALVESRGDRVELSFEQSGRIKELLVDEGDRVKAGQVLARLDDRLARARLAGAEAALEAAIARRDLAKRGPRKDEVRAAKAEV